MLLYSYIMNIKWKKIGVAYVRTCSEKNRINLAEIKRPIKTL